MKARKKNYDKTIIVEFYNDEYAEIVNKDDIESIQYNAKMLINKYYPNAIEKPNSLVYSRMDLKQIIPDLSGLTENSCLYLVGHSDIDENTLLDVMLKH
ncbi:MAG: hypothetical protein KIT56_04790 [Gammaproteobacteria bacterium]|nr:hypothetical protein [Gammaproteobacteria bacterium]